MTNLFNQLIPNLSLYSNSLKAFEPRISSFSPSTKIENNESEYDIHITLPGLKKDDLKISVEDDTLNVSYESESKDEGKNYKKINYSSFSRSFYLPPTTDIEKIKSSLEDGILSIKIPKIKAVDTKRLIEIQ